MATKEETLKELKEIFGKKILLTPEDLISIFGWRKQSIYNMISGNTFPLPVKKLGKNVFVNIIDLAHYLATSEPVVKKLDNKSARRARLEAQGIILFTTALQKAIHIHNANEAEEEAKELELVIKDNGKTRPPMILP